MCNSKAILLVGLTSILLPPSACGCGYRSSRGARVHNQGNPPSSSYSQQRAQANVEAAHRAGLREQGSARSVTSGSDGRAASGPLGHALRTSTGASRSENHPGGSDVVEPGARHQDAQASRSSALVPPAGGFCSAEFQAQFGWPDPARAATICQCESGGRSHAVSANGKYRGLFQFSEATWKHWGSGSVFDPYDNSAAAFRLFTKRGWKPWPHCSRKTRARRGFSKQR